MHIVLFIFVYLNLNVFEDLKAFNFSDENFLIIVNQEAILVTYTRLLYIILVVSYEFYLRITFT
jgi:hypothetical protein